MMKRWIIGLLMVALWQISFAEDKKYFDQIRFSVDQGYRNISASKHPDEKNLDFLNYLYNQEDVADYPYFEMGIKLRHRDIYQLDLRTSLYNNLIPYCYNFSFNYYLTPDLGILAGSMGNRYYLTEFNGFYNTIYGSKISTRAIQRQWNISLVGLYVGPSYQLNYNSLELDIAIKAGVASYYPFSQENIIKESQTNYKMVLEYQTQFHFLPFVMPEIELSMDFMRYKTAIIGGRIKYAFLFTKSAIKYEVTSYEWTYDLPQSEVILLSNHSFIQSDIDFGIFVKW